MKKKILIVSSIILVLSVGFLTFRYFNSPKYALMRIGDAIANHNYAEFEKLVNVKDLSNNFIDVYLEGEGKNSKGIVELIRDKMNDKFSSEIKKIVENTENGDKKNGISSIFSKKLYFQNIESSSINGNIATLNLNIGLKEIDTTMIIVAKMRKSDQKWQLFKFDNLAEFLKNINEREKLVLRKKNKPIKEEIQKALSYESSKTTLIKKNFNDYEIIIKNTYKNTSKKSIKEYFMIMEILNEKGDKLISLNFNHDWNKKPLEPNELITETLIFRINKYENSELIDVLASNQWNPKYIDKKLVFSNGDSLIILEKL